MTCICDIELYKEMLKEEQFDEIIEESENYYLNNVLDILIGIDETGEIPDHIKDEELFPQPY